MYYKSFPSFHCPAANQLRLAWYAAATHITIAPYQSDQAAEIVENDRENPRYYGACTRLFIHIHSCPICKGE